MAHRTSFTLDDDAYVFLRTRGGKNKSAFINDLLRKARQRDLREKILAANLEEAADAGYQEELAPWEGTLSDGIDP